MAFDGARSNRPGRFMARAAVLLLLVAGCNADDPSPKVQRATAGSSAVCGVADAATITAAGESGVAPPHVVARGMSVSALSVGQSRLHVLDAPARLLHVLDLDGHVLARHPLPAAVVLPAVAVAPDGSSFVALAPGVLVKLGPTGAELWRRPVDAPLEGLFTLGDGEQLRVGVVSRDRPGSMLFDADGRPAGRSEITGRVFAAAPDGGLVATTGRSVHRYAPDGRPMLGFGSDRMEDESQPTAAPFAFYQLGGAVATPDGTLYVADAPRGIHRSSPEGFFSGTAPDEALGQLTERSWLGVAGDRLYFAAGGRFTADQHVAWLPLEAIERLVRAPKPPALVLGFGAGLVTEEPGQFFPAGTAPAVHAHFEPWWAREAPKLSLHYAVRERRQILAGAVVPPTVVSLPTTPNALAKIPLVLPPPRPGAYEVDARLVSDDGRVVGATCLRYAVGAAGHRLDLEHLPPGGDWGGPAPQRGVELADQLGTGGLRARIEWSKLLPDPAGPMRFEVYDQPLRAAAREAAARGVAFWAQVGEGSHIETSLVRDGTWERRVAELVAHFRGVLPAWEAWNEPNNTFGSARDYVEDVLAPFARAVRAADPKALVIGGSTLGVPLDYWKGIVDAGGARSLDAAAIHPYTGHNRSWEEHGIPGAVRQLRALLDEAGARTVPLWNTESGWWSDGNANLYSQADKVARALLWHRILDIRVWSYFIMEGGYGDYGLSYSLVQGAQAPDFVKPAALAAMTATAATSGRPFTGLVDTGIPHVHAARFGPRPGEVTALVAAWTDDTAVEASAVVTGAAAVTATITDVLGASEKRQLRSGDRIALSGSPIYLAAPAGAVVTLAPTQPYGRNVAASADGAVATASSATVTNPPEAAIDGISDTRQRGDLPSLPAWASAAGDRAPTLIVRFAHPRRLDRITVTTHSNGSIVPGLRDYDVAVQSDGEWTTVARVRGQFHERRRTMEIRPRRADAVRVRVHAVNFGGLAGGARPWFWPTDRRSLSDPAHAWYGPAVIQEIEAYEAVS